MTAEDFLKHLSEDKNTDSVCLLDVRSESEFRQSSIPNSINIPILKDHERHQVGLLYKTNGQAAAIELGHQLVDSDRSNRVSAWVEVFRNIPENNRFLSCWRGGLRSRIAEEWLNESGVRVQRVVGGTKAIRTILLREFELENIPNLIVLAGLTGSRKTKLIEKIRTQIGVIDLEGLASHKGSAFGRDLFCPQPLQATFENRLAFEFFRQKFHGAKTFLLEDESARIGDVSISNVLRAKMNQCPIVFILSSLEERARFLSEDYVIGPSKRGLPFESIRDYFLSSTQRIEKK